MESVLNPMTGALIAALCLFLLLTLHRRPRSRKAKKQTEQPDSSKHIDYTDLPQTEAFPYRLRPSLLSAREYQFFRILSDVCAQKRLRAYPKVRMGDIFWVPDTLRDGKDDSLFWFWFSPIAKKHVDFVLADAQGRFVCGIEVDDSSHDNGQAQDVDLFKNRVFLSAGLPLYRFRHGFTKESILCAVSMALEKQTAYNMRKHNSQQQ